MALAMLPDAGIHDTTQTGFSPARLLAIALCVVTCMLDGYDSQSVAVTSAWIVHDLGLSLRDLGSLFGVHTLGLAIGSFCLAPWGDRLGRRPIILAGLSIVTVAMFLASRVTTLHEFIYIRILTGIGVGTLLASVNTLVAEHASLRWRNFAISAFVVAFPIGSGLAGLAVPPLVAVYGWRSVYVLGALVSLVLIPAFLTLVPESMSFLASRQSVSALQRLNKVRTTFRMEPLTVLPKSAIQPRTAYRTIFQNGMAETTIWVWLTFVMFEASTYFILSWTTQILGHAGLGKTHAVYGSVLLTAGGALGGLFVGAAATRWSASKLTSAFMVLSFAGFATWAFLPASLPMLLVATFVTGFFLFGGSAGKFTIVAAVYPAAMRVTGLGVALAVGRLGASLGPYSAGVLLSLGWSRAPLMVLLGCPLLIAAFSVERIRRLLLRNADRLSVDRLVS